ncbi:MAG: hypothetical protein AB1458_06110 [Bacteroidota bacterium]
MKQAIGKMMLVMAAAITAANASAQGTTRPTAAVVSIDSKGVISDAEAVKYMVNLEVEKTGIYSMLDKYEVAEGVAKNGIDIKSCFSRSCVVSAGKALGVDKMITGCVERFGEKIVISLKVVDVKQEVVEKQDATEYLNLQPELQKMIRISVQKLLGITPDQNLLNLLVNYDTPIESPKNQVNLNGPRMGFSYTLGEAGKVLTGPLNKGGYNMFPVMFQFGWQKEWQYLSAGNFQGLIEVLPMISGLESGKIIPSLTLMNGFRIGKAGWEFAFGPSFRVVKKANGFYGDGSNNTVKGEWYLREEWGDIAPRDSFGGLIQNPYDITSRLDSRGSATLSTGLVLAVGRTFRSGYLNMPVNLYVSPRKEGTIVGFSFGFNIYKKPKVQ